MAELPKTVGRYEIICVAGQGAMGVVYKARDPLIGRTVAIKVMSAAVSLRPDEQEEYRKRFFREAQAAGNLHHPNIVTIYDVGEEGGLPFMAQEFIEGESLSKRLKEKGAVPLNEAIAILRQMASGLAFAHEQGVVHRDIKPDNVLIDVRGRAVITDFGVARLSTSDLTRSGEVLGTPHFMSPEQVLSEPIDGRTDLFSLGVIFYLMISGQRPFAGDTISSICYHIVHSPPRPLPDSLPYPREVIEILERLLAKSKEARFAGGAELVAALDQIHDQTLSASETTFPMGAETKPGPPPPGPGTESGKTAAGPGTAGLPGSGAGTVPAGTGGGAGTLRGKTQTLPPRQPRPPKDKTSPLLIVLGALGLLALIFALIFAVIMFAGYRKALEQEKQSGEANTLGTGLESNTLPDTRQAWGKMNAANETGIPTSPPTATPPDRPMETIPIQPKEKTPAAPPASPGGAGGAEQPKEPPGTSAPPPANEPAQPAEPPANLSMPPAELRGPKGDKAHVGLIAEGLMPKVEFVVWVNGERKIQDTSEAARGPGQKAGFRLIEHLILPPGEYDLRFTMSCPGVNAYFAEETVHYRLEKAQNLILKIEPRRFPNRLKVTPIQVTQK